MKTFVMGIEYMKPGKSGKFNEWLHPYLSDRGNGYNLSSPTWCRMKTKSKKIGRLAGYGSCKG
jgi:hypothetical protein